MCESIDQLGRCCDDTRENIPGGTLGVWRANGCVVARRGVAHCEPPLDLATNAAL